MNNSLVCLSLSLVTVSLVAVLLIIHFSYCSALTSDHMILFR